MWHVGMETISCTVDHILKEVWIECKTSRKTRKCNLATCSGVFGPTCCLSGWRLSVAAWHMMSASSCTGYRPTSANTWTAWPTPASSAAPWCCWLEAAPFVWQREHWGGTWYPTLCEHSLGGVNDQWSTVAARWSTPQLQLWGRKFLKNLNLFY